MLFLYFVSTTELYQFLKVPILIEHFIEHKAKNPALTIDDFFKMHYEDPIKDSDYQKDQRLPFISHSNHLEVVFTLTPFFFYHVVENQVRLIPSRSTHYKSIFYNKEIQNSIWQPPKFC